MFSFLKVKKIGLPFTSWTAPLAISCFIMAVFALTGIILTKYGEMCKGKREWGVGSRVFVKYIFQAAGQAPCGGIGVDCRCSHAKACVD